MCLCFKRGCLGLSFLVDASRTEKLCACVCMHVQAYEYQIWPNLFFIFEPPFLTEIQN